jgi:hypothetical protein
MAIKHALEIYRFRNDSVISQDINYVTMPSIMIESLGGDGFHTGLIFRDENRQPKIMHLAWHDKLRVKNVSNGCVFVPILLPVERIEPVLALLRKLIRENATGKIPYGFGTPVNSFDKLNANYIADGDRLGLTCASFVLAAMDFAEVKLLEYDTWEGGLDSSREFQDFMIQALEIDVSEEHLQILDAQVGAHAVRYCPEEVAASAMYGGEPPMKQPETLKFSEHIKTFARAYGY